MSILKCLSESLYNEADEELDLGNITKLDDIDSDTTEEEPVEEPSEESLEEPTDTGNGDVKGDPKALVDALIKNAPGKIKEIKSMLKYAANSGKDYDIFDTAFDYFESIEDTLGQNQEDEPEEQTEPTPDLESDMEDDDGDSEGIKL